MEEVTVVDVPGQLVAGMRKKGAYDEIGNMIPAVCAHLASEGIEMAGAPMFICHEKSKEEVIEAQKNASADVEVAVPVSSKGKKGDGIRFYRLPGGKMARIVHRGPYEECGPSYERIFSWARDKGKKIIGPSREVYMNDPREVGFENAVTEIHVPIE